jgi:hypothetical protein
VLAQAWLHPAHVLRQLHNNTPLDCTFKNLSPVYRTTDSSDSKRCSSYLLTARPHPAHVLRRLHHHTPAALEVHAATRLLNPASTKKTKREQT